LSRQESSAPERSLRTAVALALALVLAAPANAERADRDKPVNVESDRMDADDAHKSAVFEGRVVLTQGTLVIRADRLTITQDAEGFQSAVALGKPARFRQKREGVNEFIEGEALRIEYDGRADRVQLFKRARVRRDSGDDVRGNYISYDAKTEHFSVQSAADAPSEDADSRVRAVIMPKNKEAPAAGAPAPIRKAPPAKPVPREQ